MLPKISLHLRFDQVYSGRQLLRCRIVPLFHSCLSVLENSTSKLPIFSAQLLLLLLLLLLLNYRQQYY